MLTARRAAMVYDALAIGWNRCTVGALRPRLLGPLRRTCAAAHRFHPGKARPQGPFAFRAALRAIAGAAHGAARKETVSQTRRKAPGAYPHAS